MVDKFSRQTFHVYNPLTLKSVGEEPRVIVHSEGYWHLAVTAFIFRGTLPDNFEVLVQERSSYVDIAQKRFDQSLATQLIVEDGSDTNKALLRGLKEELDIDSNELLDVFCWNRLGDIFISKSYPDNPELWNREIVTNYCVHVPHDIRIKGNFKVLGFEWLPWSEFCDLVRMQPNNFTKSVRLYTVADSIADELNGVFNAMLGKKTPKMLDKKMYYLSLDAADLVGFDSSLNEPEMYKTSYTMRRMRLDRQPSTEEIKKLLFGKTRVVNQLVLS